MQGIQPKSNNNGKAQMFLILLASMCSASDRIFLHFDIIYYGKCNVELVLFRYAQKTENRLPNKKNNDFYLEKRLPNKKNNEKLYMT